MCYMKKHSLKQEAWQSEFCLFSLAHG